MRKGTKFTELKKIFDILHGPKGCLWDKKQTHKSLIPYLKEESRELIHAIRKNNLHHMREELGDLLIQVMFHSKIAQRQAEFGIEDVIGELIRKLKRRHPHVFGTLKVKNTRQAIASWNKIKRQEKDAKKKNKSR